MPAMIPKSPLPLLLAGGLLWVLSQRKVAAATPSAAPRKAVTDYSSPVQAAELLASKVLAFTKGLTAQSAAVQAEEAAREAGRNAVRAGDTYYGNAAWTWYAGNTEEARRAMGEGGWTTPTITPVANAAAAPTLGGETDSIPTAALYDPSNDANRWALSALAGLP